MKHRITILLLFLICLTERMESYDKVIIWGYKLHSHTHSYIHNAFYRAFAHLGYETYWFDDNDNVKDFDFSNSLFLTAGSQENNIPHREDCDYLLHNCTSANYRSLFEKGNCIAFQVYTD